MVACGNETQPEHFDAFNTDAQFQHRHCQVEQMVTSSFVTSYAPWLRRREFKGENWIDLIQIIVSRQGSSLHQLNGAC